MARAKKGNGETGNDIYAHLHHEHERMMQLFDEIEDCEDQGQRQQLFAELKREIITHSKAEERVFYRALQTDEDAGELISDAITEHKEAERFLQDLDGMSCGSEEWLDTLQQLRSALEHHVEEEESEIFDTAHEVLTDEEAMQMSQQMEREEQRVQQELPRLEAGAR